MYSYYYHHHSCYNSPCKADHTPEYSNNRQTDEQKLNYLTKPEKKTN